MSKLSWSPAATQLFKKSHDSEMWNAFCIERERHRQTERERGREREKDRHTYLISPLLYKGGYFTYLVWGSLCKLPSSLPQAHVEDRSGTARFVPFPRMGSMSGVSSARLYFDGRLHTLSPFAQKVMSNFHQNPRKHPKGSLMIIGRQWLIIDDHWSSMFNHWWSSMNNHWWSSLIIND